MARRAQGEGTIGQYKDGRWVARLYQPDGTRKAFYGKTPKEVAQKLAAAKAQLQKGLPLPKERQTVKKYLEEWLAIVQDKVKPKTYTRYRALVTVHLAPGLGRHILARLTPHQIELFYAEKQKSGLSPTTVHHIHAVLHRALDKAQRLGLVARNVCDLVDPPRIARKEMQVWSPEEAKTFLETIKGHRLEALFVLALTSGMRQGELLALRWDDLDLDRGKLSVCATLQNIGGKMELSEPKTAGSRRQISLTPRAIDALRAHRARQNEERLHAGAYWQGYKLVFANQLGGPLDGTNLLKYWFYPLIERAGLPKIRFHDLRHTAATLLLRQGVNPKIVSEMLGHAKVQITLDTYSHVLPDMQDVAVLAMEKALL